jgi:teichuronic acid biosynthesis glycosyltransferase TuaC
MKVLVVTNMYPTPAMPYFGVFVKDQVDTLRRAGVVIDVFFVNGKASTWNYLWGFFRFWRFLRGRQYDLIHAHYVLAGVIARAQRSYPVVLTHHGPELLGHPRWQTWLAHLITPLFDEVVYVSEECRQALHDQDGWVIPCGVDLELFQPQPVDRARARLGLSPDRRLVLWAGQPRAEKRFQLVEQAMQRLQSKMPNAELVLLTGRPHADVPPYMSACDVLVLTSAAEGSPQVVKEAMACNLPIVSVRVGDVPEVIAQTAGCALAERDPEDIADKLAGVLRDPRRTDGRTRIDQFRDDRIARRVIDVYAQAMHSRRGAKQYAPS